MEREWCWKAFPLSGSQWKAQTKTFTVCWEWGEEKWGAISAGRGRMTRLPVILRCRPCQLSNHEGLLNVFLFICCLLISNNHMFTLSPSPNSLICEQRCRNPPKPGCFGTLMNGGHQSRQIAGTELKSNQKSKIWNHRSLYTAFLEKREEILRYHQTAPSLLTPFLWGEQKAPIVPGFSGDPRGFSSVGVQKGPES